MLAASSTADKPAPERTGRPCPKCGKGELLKRAGRRNSFFYACDQFPKCDYMESLEGVEIIPKRKRAAAKTAGKTATGKTAAKKTAAGKTAAKKTAAKKPAVKKTAAKKPAAKKTAGKKTAAEETAE